VAERVGQGGKGKFLSLAFRSDQAERAAAAPTPNHERGDILSELFPDNGGNSMELFDQWKSCSRCDQQQETALCVCGGYICFDCLEAHFNDDDPDFCEVLRMNPELWVEWDATRRRYFAVKVDWRTRQ
jgi:hypothetical protein